MRGNNYIVYWEQGTPWFWSFQLLSLHIHAAGQPVQIRDSNHIHCLINHGSWLMVTPIEWENNFTSRNGGPTWPKNCFLSLFVQRRRQMAHPVLTKAKPRSSHAIWAPCWNSTQLPLSHPFCWHRTKSQGCCRTWHHKLKVVRHIMHLSHIIS